MISESFMPFLHSFSDFFLDAKFAGCASQCFSASLGGGGRYDVGLLRQALRKMGLPKSLRQNSCGLCLGTWLSHDWNEQTSLWLFFMDNDIYIVYNII